MKKILWRVCFLWLFLISNTMIKAVKEFELDISEVPRIYGKTAVACTYLRWKKNTYDNGNCCSDFIPSRRKVVWTVGTDNVPSHLPHSEDEIRVSIYYKDNVACFGSKPCIGLYSCGMVFCLTGCDEASNLQLISTDTHYFSCKLGNIAKVNPDRIMLRIKKPYAGCTAEECQLIVTSCEDTRLLGGN